MKRLVHTDPYWLLMVRTSTGLLNPIGSFVYEIQLVFKQELYIKKKKKIPKMIQQSYSFSKFRL